MNGSEATGPEVKLTRSFVAVPMPDEWQELIIDLQRRLAEQLDGVRWVRPENIHLTLSFFGDQTEEALDKIAKIMLSINTLSRPFTLWPARIGVFPNERRSQVLWLGLEPQQPLLDLQRELMNGWRQAGIVVETRKFRPHLTLGRLRNPRSVAKELLTGFTVPTEKGWRVDQIILYESRLKPTGAEHLPRRVALLGR